MNNAKEDKKRGDIFIGFIVFICFVLLIYVVVKMGGVSVWERTRADQGKAGGRSAGGYFLAASRRKMRFS